MIRRWLQYAVFLGLLLPLAGRAENNCPWLNEATAAGALSGPVTLTVQSTADEGTICLFQGMQTAANSSLQIEIHPVKDVAQAFPVYKARCSSQTTVLRAIGNEAIQCGAGTKSVQAEQVIGRVREKVFLVTISSTLEHHSTMKKEALQEKTRNIAEQVAGALF